jgi:hypothetical protein
MNRGAAVMMMMMVALSLARGVSAAEPPADHRLLGTLREERRIMFKKPSPARLERPSEDLARLVGVSRREVLLSPVSRKSPCKRGAVGPLKSIGSRTGSARRLA